MIQGISGTELTDAEILLMKKECPMGVKILFRRNKY